MSLETVKTLTGVDNEQIATIYTMYEKRLFSRLEQSLLEVIEIPEGVRIYPYRVYYRSI